MLARWSKGGKARPAAEAGHDTGTIIGLGHPCTRRARRGGYQAFQWECTWRVQTLEGCVVPKRPPRPGVVRSCARARAANALMPDARRNVR